MSWRGRSSNAQRRPLFCRRLRQGMQDSADTTRFFGGGAMFLTGDAQGTGATVSDAGSIEHAHRSIVFGASFLRIERGPKHDGTVRVLYAARIADCRSCPLRILCQGHGTSTKKPRRVSAVLHPLSQPVPEEQPASCLSAPPPHPILWGDWSRCQPR